MMLMYLDSDDSENSDFEPAGIGMTAKERLLLEAPTSTEQNNRQNSSEEDDVPPRKRIHSDIVNLNSK